VVVTESQLATWFVDRARQALLGTNIAPWVRSRGDHMRRLNNGVALRTYRSIAGRREAERSK
jgi:hypothetical protein